MYDRGFIQVSPCCYLCVIVCFELFEWWGEISGRVAPSFFFSMVAPRLQFPVTVKQYIDSTASHKQTGRRRHRRPRWEAGRSDGNVCKRQQGAFAPDSSGMCVHACVCPTFLHTPNPCNGDGNRCATRSCVFAFFCMTSITYVPALMCLFINTSNVCVALERVHLFQPVCTCTQDFIRGWSELANSTFFDTGWCSCTWILSFFPLSLPPPCAPLLPCCLLICLPPSHPLSPCL